MLDMKNDLDTAFLDLIGQIANSLAEIAEYMAPAAPNWTHDIGAFAGFDWSSIGAIVAKADEFGPSAVEWRGKAYTRRSPQNKFGAAIWFSRPSGKTEDGSVRYERLITFKPISEAEPISREAEKVVRQAPSPQAAPPQVAPPQVAPRRQHLAPPPPDDDGWDEMRSATEDPAVQQALAKAANGKRPAWQDPADHAGQIAEEAAAKAAFMAQRTGQPPVAPPPSHAELDLQVEREGSKLAGMIAKMTALAASANNPDAAKAIVTSAKGQAAKLDEARAEKAVERAIIALKGMQS